MSPEILINPFIIYWDLEPDTSVDDNLISRICEELIAAKIFILNLRDLSGLLSERTVKIIQKLNNSQIKIELSVGSKIFEHPSLMDIIKVEELFIEFRSSEELSASIGNIKEYIDQRYSVGVSFYLSRKNFQQLPEVISQCIKNNIDKLTLPIQRANQEIFYPDLEAAQWLSEKLRQIDLKSLNLTIHDPFIWDLFYNRENPNKEGCNAARTMMYISENFDVTPCPILNVSLGNLREFFLEEIFSSEKRVHVRKELSTPPEECNSCEKVNTCRGGCRGRTYTIFGHYNKPDPGCYYTLF
jgi:GeoRSP system SPASM domain protein